MNTPEWIERIQEREAETTSGPWENIGPLAPSKVDHGFRTIAGSSMVLVRKEVVSLSKFGRLKREADFVTHARQDIPALLEHCLMLREVLGMLKEELKIVCVCSLVDPLKCPACLCDKALQHIPESMKGGK